MILKRRQIICKKVTQNVNDRTVQSINTHKYKSRSSSIQNSTLQTDSKTEQIWNCTKISGTENIRIFQNKVVINTVGFPLEHANYGPQKSVTIKTIGEEIKQMAQKQEVRPHDYSKH